MKSVEDKLKSAKDKYVEKREAQINKWNAELENLDAKITAAGVDAKVKLAHQEHIAALRQKRDAAKAKLAEVQAAGDDTWEDLKDGLESIWASIKDGFEKVKAKF
jgi:predicted  nucleic acid-binding Zn-ribbon protein